jgi:hypothetical protein
MTPQLQQTNMTVKNPLEDIQVCRNLLHTQVLKVITGTFGPEGLEEHIFLYNSENGAMGT